MIRKLTNQTVFNNLRAAGVREWTKSQRKMGQVPGLNFETTNEVTSRVARGKTTVRAVVDACLARIDAREPAVHALTYWDARTAIAQAESIDRHPGARRIRGLVAGVKDVIDTAD